MLVSIVIPCYQNQLQLRNTVSGIFQVIASLKFKFEVVLVDDASNDQTWRIIESLAAEHQEVVGIQLQNNVGAYNAITYGFDESAGDLILVMAADGDDSPNLIPAFFELLDNKTDAVLAARDVTARNFFQALFSNFFESTLRLVGAKNLLAGGSDFLLVRKSVLNGVQTKRWKSGNTLIQLVQNAKDVKSFKYIKGSSRKSSWTFSKKVKLFVQTVNQFAAIPGVSTSPTRTTISERC